MENNFPGHVLILAAHWPPRPSGHGDYTWHLASTLVHRGSRVTVFVLGQSEIESLPGAETYSTVFPSSLKKISQLVAQIRKSGADVVCLQFEANAFQLRATPHLLPLALKLAGLRVVMMYHELWKPKRFGVISKLLLLNAPDRVIVFSRWQADGVRKFRRASTPPDIIPVGTNIVFAAGRDRNLLRARFGISANATVISFFGFILREHKVHELVDALSLLRKSGVEATLSVIGGFDPEKNGYHQQLLRQARDLGVEQFITWHGRVVDAAAVARLIEVSSIGVLPYDTGVGENNGAFAAFSAAGVPTITTTGARSQFMEAEKIAVFVKPESAAIAAGILSLVSNPDEAEAIAARASLWAARRSWDNIAAAYERVFSDEPAPVELL